MQASPDPAHGAKVQIVASGKIRGEQAKELGATCHIFRDIDVFSAFPMVAPKRAASGKALKTSISRNI